MNILLRKITANSNNLESDLPDKFGPCGLLCEKCFAYNKGPIRFHAEMLRNDLGAFDNYAKRFVTLLDEPAFSKYPDFKEFLYLISTVKCNGCRKQECHIFVGCKVKECYKAQKIDFCFQCKEFPCDNTGFDVDLKERWIRINNKIRESGLEKYYSEVKDKPRY